MDSNEIFLYWRCRQQNLKERANCICLFIELLNGLVGGKTISLYGKKIQDTMHQSILEQIKKSVKKHYKLQIVEDDFTEHIGSVISLSGENFTVSFIAGGCQKDVPNSVILKGKILSTTKALEIFKHSKGYFKPDWGVLTQFDFCYNTLGLSVKEFLFGWATYFSSSIQVPAIPDAFDVEEIRGLGKIIITTKGVFSPNDCESLVKCTSLVELFRQDGIWRV